MSSRRPRRQRRRPRERVSTLPRPVAGAAATAPGQPVVPPSPSQRPDHHVVTDYRYVRRDLVAVGVVGGLTLAFVLVAAVIA